MTSNEARTILRAYRPGKSAEDDPHFAQALALAGQDAGLGAWLDEQNALHDAMRSKFGEIPVPANLRERILADRKVARPTFWRRSPVALAAAAALVVVIGIAALIFPDGASADLRAYRRDMVQFVADLYRMNARARTWDELRQAFAKQGWPADYVVPAALRSVRLEGGCMHYWREQKVSLACMKTGEGQGMWLFVINRAALPSGCPTPQPQFADVGKLRTATWCSEDKTYLLATDGGLELLKKHL